MTILKRLNVPWAKEKKNAKFIIVPRGAHPQNISLPLLVVIRDILKFADNSNEARKIIKTREVFVDGKVCTDANRGVGLFDVVDFPSAKKSYRIVLDKLPNIIEIPNIESKLKLCKIINKKVLRGGKIQLNLHDGRNLLLDKNDYSTNDSLLLELPNQRIKEHIKFEEGCLVDIFGKVAKVKKIEKETNRLWIETGEEIPYRDFIVVGKDKPVIVVNNNE